MKVGKLTKIFLISAVTIVIGFDIIILIAEGAKATVSYQVWLIGFVFPFLPYAMGVLVMHFFSPAFFKRVKFKYFIWISVSAIVLFLSIRFYPITIIHPIIWLLFGQVMGVFWAQEKIK